jgi:UDP-2,3-diacylglucosamine hydrolase
MTNGIVHTPGARYVGAPMSDQPLYVISDIHLGGVPSATERAFRAFLRHVGDNASELLINGDLFDFWFEYRSVILSQHFRVLGALADLRDAGIPVYFVGGNHDAWGGSFLRDELGIEVLAERAELELAGRRALVVHGDGLGEGDLGYRVLKRVIRHPLSVRAFRLLHPDLGTRIATRVSTTESKHGTPHLADWSRAEQVEKWARAELGRRPDLDLILAGHTHTPAIREVESGRYYINTGDWINHFSYLVLTPNEPPELRTWR